MAIPWVLKVLWPFFLAFSLLVISIGFGTGIYVLAIIGLGLALIPSFFFVLCRLPVLRDHLFARSMGPRRVRFDRLER
jgi:hypothetical protein